MAGFVFRHFLSRLCGGERKAAPVAKDAYFLSRLCGGERSQCLDRLRRRFLSRLCGGERHGARAMSGYDLSKPPMRR